MKDRLGKLAGQLGIAYCLAGLFLVFLGWNGAATYDRVSAQLPYLISGGVAGLCLVVIGGSIIVASSARAGAAALEATVAELRESVDRMSAGGQRGATGSRSGAAMAAGRPDASPDQVVAGPTSYHRPDCRLVEGQAEAGSTTAAAAEAAGLTPCRVCNPSSDRVAAQG
jgi:hypothetical protein